MVVCMILNTTTNGDGPTLILLHGLFGAAKNLGALARGLGAQARVISMDLRNHGESPHGAAMDFATMAADVAETMHSLGLPQASIVGHSLGGKTAMALALTQPQLVERQRRSCCCGAGAHIALCCGCSHLQGAEHAGG